MLMRAQESMTVDEALLTLRVSAAAGEAAEEARSPSYVQSPCMACITYTARSQDMWFCPELHGVGEAAAVALNRRRSRYVIVVPGYGGRAHAVCS